MKEMVSNIYFMSVKNPPPTKRKKREKKDRKAKKKSQFLNRSFKHCKPWGGAKVTKEESSQTHSDKMCRMWPDEI